MTDQQQGDVKLFQTDDGGNIIVEDGLVAMAGGLETAAYLSLFGGNEDDDGRSDNSLTWWGNLDENDPARQYRSETQHLLQALPLTTGNLRRIEDAALRDLTWLIGQNIAGLNRVKLTVDIEARGEESRFEFVENWKARA